MKMKYSLFAAMVAALMLMFMSTPTHAQQETIQTDLQSITIDALIVAAVESIEVGCSEDITHQMVYADLTVSDSVDVTDITSQEAQTTHYISTVVPLHSGETNRIIYSSAEHAAYTRGFSHPLRC